MKKIILLTSIIFLVSINVNGQKKNLAQWYEWTDSTAFAEGPDPIMKEVGPLSDSLSKVYSNKMIFIANNQYYIINTLADYYLWFMDRYPSLFKGEITDYYTYYEERYDYGMYDFIRNNYTGKHFPIPFKSGFTSKRIDKKKEKNTSVANEKDETWRRWQQDQRMIQNARSARGTTSPAPSSPTPKVKLNNTGSN